MSLLIQDFPEKGKIEIKPLSRSLHAIVLISHCLHLHPLGLVLGAAVNIHEGILRRVYNALLPSR